MEFVTYELAVKLKEKGFDWVTSNVYERNTLACRYEDYPKPTISQVLKWLREEHATHIEISLGRNGWYFEIIQYEYYEEEKEYDCKLITVSVINDSYEQAALTGVEYVLDNLI